ncbi:vWA domain-containing protein [Streptomyces sp. 6N223]|uniref:vWA domain-containing protein n=1 Tax=Streptomyces sp. 6N223 TaxID=3457412 RepID=UPI003FD1870A
MRWRRRKDRATASDGGADADADVYDGIEIDDTAQRLPLVLCLDTSHSMTGAPIAALNDALREWAGILHTDISLSHSVEIALVTFGSGGVGVWRGPEPAGDPAQAFVSAYAFEAPALSAGGATPMTEALELAMHLVETRKEQLRAAGLQYYRPQICLLTDGLPTDDTGHLTKDWQRLVPVLAERQRSRRFRLFAIGVGGLTERGERVLRSLAPRFNARLTGFPFRDVLQMMSASANAEQRGAGDEVFERIFQDLTQRPAWE